jgi:prevent-host-death family protein
VIISSVKIFVYIPGHNFRADASDLLVLKLAVVFYEKLLIIMNEVILMPNIKPISDLRNYGEVLRDVAIGSPVFLTKNGQGRYAVLDIGEYEEYEKMLAWRHLITKLDEGRRSGAENGWVPANEVKAHFEKRYSG